MGGLARQWAIRTATPSDAATIHALIVELADYERLADHVVATPADTAAALFGDAPKVFCDIAEVDGETVGFALWFHNYSTFRGRHGIYLEDLFVRPQHRGLGVGKALIATLARRCVDEGLGRLQWAVLDWNTPSIAFYENLGATIDHDWLGCRLQDAALRSLAHHPSPQAAQPTSIQVATA